jgi:ubiquinone biosynthesis protein Coq4
LRRIYPKFVTLLVSVTSLSLEQRILSKTKPNALVKSVMATIDSINVSTHLPQQSLTLRQGLERYYQANPDFVRNQDLWVGIMRIPWCDMQRHDIMHVVTGYSTALEQELQLIGFLLTALTWKRPWYYYAQSFVVFLELLWQSIQGKAWGGIYHNPVQVCRLYLKGVKQGLTVPKKINAAIDPETVLDRDLESLRSEYGIQNAGAWD